MNIVVSVGKFGGISILKYNQDNKFIGFVEEEDYKYYKDIMSLSLSSADELSAVSDNNGTISYKNKDNNITIEGCYNDCSDSDIEKIIMDAIIMHRKLTRENIKGQKVKRNSPINKRTIIIIGFILITLLKPIVVLEDINYDLNAENINSDTVVETVVEDRNTEDNLYTLENKTESVESDKVELKHVDEGNNVGFLNVNSELKNVKNYNLEYDDYTRSEKLQNTKNLYGELITKYSYMYGLDPELMIAIATQESGVHSTSTEKPAIGLMQIEKAVWNNKYIRVYNNSSSQYEDIFITIDNLKDVEFNIKVGCAIFKNYLEECNYNVEMAIQMYNFGPGNINKVIADCYGNNVSKKDVTDSEWLEHRGIIEDQGDIVYLENVLRYLEEPKEVEVYDKNNNPILFSFNNVKKTI